MEAAAVILKFPGQVSVGHRKDLRRQQTGIEAPTNGDGGHRNPPRHLHDRVEGIDPGQRPAFHRHADHGQGGEGGHHAGEMGGPASAGDDHPKPLTPGRLSEVHHLQGGAMGREHPNLHLHPQLAQDGGGGFHGGQVRVTAHHNGNTGEHWRHNAEGQDCHRLPPWLQKPVLR